MNRLINCYISTFIILVLPVLFNNSRNTVMYMFILCTYFIVSFRLFSDFDLTFSTYNQQLFDIGTVIY